MMRGDHYTEDFKPHYRYRDESYGDREKYLVERVTPTGGMSWGITCYTSKEAAQKAVDALNALVLKEVP
jgi:hypothetical protein